MIKAGGREWELSDYGCLCLNEHGTSDTNVAMFDRAEALEVAKLFVHFFETGELPEQEGT